MAYALTAVVLWSTVATAFKLGLQVLAPTQLLLLATLVSLACFWLVALITRNTRIPIRAWPIALGLGLLNPWLYYTVLFEAYARLPAQIAQPLNYTWAITLALLAVPLLKQPITPRIGAGIVVGYLGVVLLLTGGRIDAVPDLDWVGVTLALVSTVLWALYWLLNTRSSVAAIPLLAWSFLFATPAVALTCLLGPGLPALTTEAVAFGTWVGLVEMGVTFLLWQTALRRTASAARTGALIFLSPFLSLVLIHNVLDEAVQPSSVAGLAVIVLGLAIAGRSGRHPSA